MFHGASANGFWYRSQKPQGADSPPPPTSNRVKPKSYLKLTEGEQFPLSALRFQ